MPERGLMDGSISSSPFTKEKNKEENFRGEERRSGGLMKCQINWPSLIQCPGYSVATSFSLLGIFKTLKKSSTHLRVVFHPNGD